MNYRRSAQGRRRAFGQHFLKDQEICKRIANEALNHAEKFQTPTLLEIGPGKGAITEYLIESLRIRPSFIRRFLICEKDRNLASHWIEEAKELPLLEIFDTDFLQLPSQSWLEHAPLTIVSNLPYSVGTAIFTALARNPSQIRSMVLMFQSEVAQRLRAEKGTKDWGSLSLWTQNQWEIRKLLTAPPGAFSPPPQVHSEVVVLTPRSTPRIPGTETNQNEELWEALLKACFAHRRKMLRAGLPRSGPLRNALELSGLDDTKRAEALDWNEWETLFHALVQSKNG